MNQTRKNENSALHIRRSIQAIDDSIDQLQKARAGLVAMLPRKNLKPVDFRIELPDGRVIGPKGWVTKKDSSTKNKG